MYISSFLNKYTTLKILFLYFLNDSGALWRLGTIALKQSLQNGFQNCFITTISSSIFKWIDC